MKKLIYLIPIFMFLVLISLSSVNASICYQESLNVTNQTGIDGSCGLNYTGKHTFTNGAGGLLPSQYIDGDWSSSASAGGRSIVFTTFYKIPSQNFTGITTEFKWKDSAGAGTIRTLNITVNQSCVDYAISSKNLTLVYSMYSTMSVACYNSSTTTVTMYSLSGAYNRYPDFFEQAVRWNITDVVPPSNSCTYSGSGTWAINISDNCTLQTQTINSPILVTGNNGMLVINGTLLANKSISFVPTGTFTGKFIVAILKGSYFGVFK